jgi:hypothetical protein
MRPGAQKQNQPAQRIVTGPAPAPGATPGPNLHAQIRYLQGAAGNNAVQRLLKPPQAETPTANSGTKAAAPGAAPDSGPAEEAGSRLTWAEQGVRGPGQPLPVGTRALLEAQFDRRFADVRLHTGPRAADAARRLSAAAYTLGRDIAFGAGFYAPHTGHGLRLLAHELAHVVQARNAMPRSAPADAPPVVAPLEREAEAAAAGLGRGRTRVQGRLAAPTPLCHPIYISSHGTQGYLDKAAKFYADWGYAPVHRKVPSIEAIVQDLAGQPSINHITIVSHANPELLQMQFITGGPDTVRKSDWQVDTVDKLAVLERHLVNESTLNTIIDYVNIVDPKVLPAIGVGTNPLARQFIWWVAEQVSAVNSGYSAAGYRLRDIAQKHADRYRAELLSRPTGTGSGSGSGQPAVTAQTLSDAEQAVRTQAQRFPWDKSKLAPEKVPAWEQQLKESPTADIIRIRQKPEFFDNLKKVRGKISAGSWIEIQGCNAGKDPAYLSAIQSFFGGAARPKVTAPDWLQIFGEFGWTSISDTEKKLQEEWQKPGVPQALRYWYPIVMGKKLPPKPTHQTLRDYLLPGHVLPPAPTGTSATRRVVFLYNRGPGPDPNAFLRWLSRHQYLITKWADIQKQFFSQGTFGANVNNIVVDWLQETYPGAGRVIFRPSPDYDKHIISAP